MRRKKAEVKNNMTEEEFKQALFNWALRHDAGDNYIDDDEGILEIIEKYQEKLPTVILPITIRGGEIPALMRGLDDLGISEDTKNAIRAAVPQ